MLPVVDLSGKSAFQIFFVGDATQVHVMFSGYHAVSSVSVSAATHLAYDTYASSHVRNLISPLSYFCLGHKVRFSYWCVRYLLFLFVFLLR